jgi:hypothetical protein
VVIAMDEFEPLYTLQDEIDEAIALDDEVRARHARMDRQRAAREREEARSQMVYKTYEPPQPVQQYATKDDGWNRWFAESFHNHFAENIARNNEMLVDVIGEEVGALDNAVVKKLQTEIGSLRAELEVLRSIVRGEVTSIKGKSSDAA